MKVFISVFLGICLFALLESCKSSNNSQKIGFMENIKVFEEFTMKKDYDLKIEEDISKEVQVLDSIQLLVNKMSIQGNQENLKQLKQEYFQKQEQYNQLFKNLSTKYTTEVNDRLNGYIKDFSNKKGYDIILGSGGEGNVMFTKEKINITDELIIYINEKYSN
tara:strand:- start:7436 stop:7924 length:489 start_codon:yes stop_codon:yes gene_type:complete